MPVAPGAIYLELGQFVKVTDADRPGHVIGAGQFPVDRIRFFQRQPQPDHHQIKAQPQHGVPHINLGILRGIPIPRPQLTEQTAIAAVLSDMDDEIAALESRRDKTKLLKQGMMQELLTGSIRLI